MFKLLPLKDQIKVLSFWYKCLVHKDLNYKVLPYHTIIRDI